MTNYKKNRMFHQKEGKVRKISAFLTEREKKVYEALFKIEQRGFRKGLIAGAVASTLVNIFINMVM